MGQKNAYFQLSVRPEGTFLKIHPASDMGAPLDINEVVDYLNRHDCKNFDIKDLNRTLVMGQESEILVGQIYPLNVNEEMKMHVSADSMLVTCRFYPASEGGTPMSAQEILNDLNAKGIRAGIRQDEILKFINNRLFSTNYLLVTGKPPKHGHDAKIEYFFNTDLSLKPKRNEDGTVDYRELDIIHKVEKGALLAKLHQADEGEMGVDVFGKEVKPRTVHKMKLEHGKNISLSEDQTEMYSDVTGHVSLVDGKVFVSDVFTVPADVDNSIGNIHYPGNVHINGNVKGGFSVIAEGDVEIDGIVEDASVQAGGRIVVKRGIHGMTRGVLKAKGDIICRFVENATIVSGGSVEAESILHSQISASDTVKVNGKKGFITGGVIRAGNMIEAQTIGSVVGAATRVEVGVPPEQKERFAELQQWIVQNTKTMAQIRPILLAFGERMARGEKIPADKAQYVEQLTQTMRAKEEEMLVAQKEYAQLHNMMLHNDNARVRVSRTICSGVTVCISDISMTMKDDRSYCQLVVDAGEISIIPL